MAYMSAVSAFDLVAPIRICATEVYRSRRLVCSVTDVVRIPLLRTRCTGRLPTEGCSKGDGPPRFIEGGLPIQAIPLPVSIIDVERALVRHSSGIVAAPGPFNRPFECAEREELRKHETVKGLAYAIREHGTEKA